MDDGRGLKGLEELDRGKLIESMQSELPEMGVLDLTDERLSDMSGIGMDRLRAAKRGSLGLKWSEYLTLLFIFWKNDRSRHLIEEKGLFPKELKEAMATNRYAHAPSDMQ